MLKRPGLQIKAILLKTRLLFLMPIFIINNLRLEHKVTCVFPMNLHSLDADFQLISIN
jgi:hypothetical protein